MFSNSPADDPRLSRYDHVIIHVTATGPDLDLDDKDIDRMHRNRGFSSCGYNALIKRDGTWLDSDGGALTRAIGKQGAHVGGCGRGWNGRSFGVSLVGGVDDANRPEFNMTDAQMATLQAGLRRFLDLHPDAENVQIMGHRDLIKITDAAVKKACPCFDVIPWWEARRDAAPVPAPSEPQDLDSSQLPSPVDRPRFWTVASGDTMSQIVRVTGVSIAEILAMNPEIADPNMIAVGEVIRLE